MNFLAPMLASTLLGSFKKGGAVKKTGPYLLHAGEVVIPSRVVSKYKRMAAGPPPSRPSVLMKRTMSREKNKISGRKKKDKLMSAPNKAKRKKKDK